MKTATKLALATAAGLLFAQPLSAQTASGHDGHHMGFMHGGGSPFMMLLKAANLTPAQHAQLHEILQSERAQMKAVYQQSHAVHEQIADKLLGAGSVTVSNLAPIEQKAARLQQQIDQSRLDTALAIRNILTSDQISHLAQVHRQLENMHAQIQSLMGSDQSEAADQTN